MELELTEDMFGSQDTAGKRSLNSLLFWDKKNVNGAFKAYLIWVVLMVIHI